MKYIHKHSIMTSSYKKLGMAHTLFNVNRVGKNTEIH